MGSAEAREERSNNPNVIWIAIVIFSAYGVVLEKTSKMVFGVSKSLLPYPEEDIKEAIDLLLTYLENKSRWDELRREFPDVAGSILTNKFYNALKVGYIQLAKFISDDEEAKIAVKLGTFLMQKSELNEEDKEKFKEIRSALIKVQQKIGRESTILFEELIKKHGKDEKIFDE